MPVVAGKSLSVEGAIVVNVIAARRARASVAVSFNVRLNVDMQRAVRGGIKTPSASAGFERVCVIRNRPLHK